MRTARVQALALAAQFAAATRHQPRTDETPKRVRVEVDLPPGLSDQARRTVLAACAGADRFGHDCTRQGAVVWAELDQRRAK
ncbi:hypothetical protein [Streptomyces sp. ISL-11]|uniref:hypothetical protein n=1 Tax=Streptomyces sp. ISL-11 TaxID=2819174 RepID=UPI001BE84D9C|nr:hypothetical protein [Streptomyces sp. ISL-11]MBT2384023.1 hypothetical protein [Streptomyces sp. ISL-11]